MSSANDALYLSVLPPPSGHRSGHKTMQIQPHATKKYPCQNAEKIMTIVFVIIIQSFTAAIPERSLSNPEALLLHK
jgi:hypothetical protein